MTECSCKECIAECTRVTGWFTPGEARLAIEAGLAERITDVNKSVTGLAPLAERGNRGRCTFLTADNLCELHETSFKPIECRTGFGCDKSDDSSPSIKEMFEMWGSEEGKIVYQLWLEKVRN